MSKHITHDWYGSVYNATIVKTKPPFIAFSLILYSNCNQGRGFCKLLYSGLLGWMVSCLRLCKYTIADWPDWEHKQCAFHDWKNWFDLVEKTKQSTVQNLLYIRLKTYYMNHAMRKCVLCHMRTTKTQISLRIRAVWSASLLFAA